MGPDAMKSSLKFAVVLATAIALLGGGPSSAGSAEPLAKELFGAAALPAATKPEVHGFYSKGCYAGGIAIAPDGPTWQAMRLSRNRNWGHPDMVRLLERLSRDAAADGWRGLLIGDISQPRGGPMLTGHASHQIGLDADVWFTPMPERRFTLAERENVSAVSMLKDGSLHVDDRRWTRAHEAVLRHAAKAPNVERILVHPGIKKKLCDTVGGDRSWLSKVRPFWGHHYHFHIRIGCPAGSAGCKGQAPPPRGDGCDKSLDWWFTEEPWRPAKGPEKPKARDVMKLSDLPSACRAVLAAPGPASVESVTLRASGFASAATAPALGSFMSVLPEIAPIPVPRPER